MPVAGVFSLAVLVGALVSASPALIVAGCVVCFCTGTGLHTSRRGKFLAWADVLDGLHLRGDERLLDVGCGRGAVLIAAARRLPHGRAVGVDIWSRVDQSGNGVDSTVRNAAAEGVSARVAPLTANMMALPFPPDTFDVIVSNVAIHNISGRAGRAAAIAEAARVLRPGGRLLIADLAFTGAWAKQLASARHGRRRSAQPGLAHVVGRPVEGDVPRDGDQAEEWKRAGCLKCAANAQRRLAGRRRAIECRVPATRSSNHEDAQTRQQRPGSLGPRARLHGDELFLRPAQGQAGDDRAAPGRRANAASRSSTPPRSTARSRTRSSWARPSLRSASRW